MKINVEKILGIQSKEFIKDADFAYDDTNNELNTDSAHMIGQKTLLRVNVIDSFLNNTISENDIQKSTMLLSKKMLKQVQNDVDYMYPNENYEENNAHVVMQLIKRTGEDLSVFLECFQQKHEVESKINIVYFLKEQFKEYNNDLDYAYPQNNYDDSNAHIVLQGLLGKSEFIYNVLDNAVAGNDEEKEFKTIYLDKISGLIELLNNGYSSEGYYLENGHDIFSQLIEGLKVEIKDLQEIRLSDHEELDKSTLSINGSEQEIKTTVLQKTSEPVHTTPAINIDKENSIQDKTVTVDYHQDKSEQPTPTHEEDVFEKPVRNEEVRKKLKNIM